MNKRSIQLLIIYALLLSIGFLPPPDGLTVPAWRLMGIFLATIFGLITTPLPMGAMIFVSLSFTMFSKTLTVQQALSGYSSDVVWLVTIAFFIAKGFVETGLGNRIAYFFTGLLGKRTLGLGYGLTITELLIAPGIPSMTARSGGIVYPILQGITHAYDSNPHHPSARKVGAYLTSVAFHATVVTSAMFMTAMAANPLIVSLTLKQNETYNISWGTWALAAIVPGLISLAVMPLILYYICPPEIKETPNAAQIAKEHLKAMGKMKKNEWLMLCTLLLLLILWIFGQTLHISAVEAAFIGLSCLLLTKVVQWKTLLKEEGAWDNLFWFGALLMMAQHLNELGAIEWFSSKMVRSFVNVDWVIAFPIVALIYFYSHYLFASATAHVSSMYLPMLAISIQLGTPPMLAIFTLMFTSNLFGCLTHYSCGPAALLYGAGFIKIKEWWKLGAIASLVHIIVWGGIGSLWWKFLGYW